VVFAIAARHAALGFDIATTVRDALESAFRRDAGPELVRVAERASAWETRADQLLNTARDDIKRFKRPALLLAFLESADDAVDELEEAASLLQLLTLAPATDGTSDPLRKLADTALSSSQELIKCIECAATITRSDVRDDLDDFLKSLDRLIALEHRADELVRTIRRALVMGSDDARTLFLIDQMARALESATDAYAHSGQSLRAYLMEEILA
jgi:uncharacterized protein Yka (UPF0111/DUF47 family)